MDDQQHVVRPIYNLNANITHVSLILLGNFVCRLPCVVQYSSTTMNNY